MTWQDRFYESMAGYLREERKLDVAKVTSVAQETGDNGMDCSCYSQYNEIIFYYEDSKGDFQRYRFYGDLSDLLQ